MPPGRIGPYELGELIDDGGMGEVYRARDTRLGRDAPRITRDGRFAYFSRRTTEGDVWLVTLGEPAGTTDTSK
jgi:hypothetical protein